MRGDTAIVLITGPTAGLCSPDPRSALEPSAQPLLPRTACPSRDGSRQFPRPLVGHQRVWIQSTPPLALPPFEVYRGAGFAASIVDGTERGFGGDEHEGIQRATAAVATLDRTNPSSLGS